MACDLVRFTVTANNQSIKSTNSQSDWYNWFDGAYMKLSQVAKDNILNRMSANSKTCFNDKLAVYLQTKATNAAKCVPNSNETRTVEKYKKDCVYNNVGLQTTLGRFYGSADDSVANYKNLFDTKRDLAQNEINEISSIITSFPKAMVDINTQITAKNQEIAKINQQIKELEDKTNAYEQQFIEDKAKIGKTVDKRKLNVLQDYLLASFFISYFFFALVAIFYVTKINDYSWKIFGMMLLLSIIIGGLMTAVINYTV